MGLFVRLNASIYYWLFMIVTGVALEIAALYYQYGLDYEPCVLCIHVRIWVMALMLIGVLGLFLRNSVAMRTVVNVLSVGAAAGFLERGWQTLAIERGWSEGGSCNMSAGLPTWFDLERWFPAVFEVRDACGYTPYIIAKISMAEILVPIGVMTLIVTVLMTVFTLISARQT